MNGETIRTRSEQRLEWLEKQGRRGELTPAESDELHRCLHAIYVREWRKRRAAA